MSVIVRVSMESTSSCRRWC